MIRTARRMRRKTIPGKRERRRITRETKNLPAVVKRAVMRRVNLTNGGLTIIGTLRVDSPVEQDTVAVVLKRVIATI
jgi:hypothetical protein